MSKINLSELNSVHFIGLGGIGVSAVARMMLLEGKTVSGSDRKLNNMVEKLIDLGASFYEGHSASNLPKDTEAVIYTVAISEDNPELVLARERGLPTLTYSQALGVLSEDYRTVAVAGTHGKTTTTAMLNTITSANQVDATVIVGSLLLGGEEESNLVIGQSSWLIVEACEYKRSFLDLWPEIVVITNIDEDHLDYYRDIAEIKEVFRELVSRIPETGALVCDVGDPELSSVIRAAACPVIDYQEVKISDLCLPMPGRHNRLNARAALAAAYILGVDQDRARSALSNFTGTHRRLQCLGQTGGRVKVYDDYAHHPTEIAASLEALRERYPTARLVVVFQPHLYSRTAKLLTQFGGCFQLAEEVIVAPIYAAREKDPGNISNHSLAVELRRAGLNARSLVEDAEIMTYLEQSVEPGDVLVFMGAGDIGQSAQAFLRITEEQTAPR